MPASPSPPPRVSFWEWSQAALLFGNIAWTTLCLGGYRPETMVVTGSLTTLLVAVHFASRIFERETAPRLHPAGWWPLPFLAYAVFNVQLVSPVRWLGWLEWFGWAQMAAVFWVTLNGLRSRAPRRILFLGLVALALVAVWLGGYQRFARPDWLMLGRLQAEQFVGRASGPFGIPNSLAAFLLLLLPATGALAFRARSSMPVRVWWGWVTLVLAFGLLLTISRGAWLGFVIALAIWPLCAARWSWRKKIASAAGVLALAVAAGAVLYAGSPKVRARASDFVADAGERTRPILWRASWELFREKPVFGTGAASFNMLFEKHRPERFPLEPRWTHNDYLNTLSDYGAVGFLLCFGGMGGLGVICWLRARRRESDRKTAVGDDAETSMAPPSPRGGFETALAIGLLAFALQLFVDFHFKIPALAMMFATLGGRVIAAKWPATPAQDRDRHAHAGFSLMATGGLAVALVVAWVMVFLPAYRAEALRYRARQIIDRVALTNPSPAEHRARLATSAELLGGAVELNPANADAWSDFAYVTALQSRTEAGKDREFGRQAEAAADRALALSPHCYEFWIRRGVARDLQARWFEAGADFTRALKLASANAAAWYYHAQHLGRRANMRNDALAAVDFCLRLDPQNHDGLALRQRLAISAKEP